MSRVGAGLISLLLSLVVVACSGVATGGLLPPPSTATPKPAKPRSTPKPTPTPSPTPAPVALTDLVGTDGRLTVLILGSDKRKGLAGERTDAIIVASIDPDTGQVAMVSMPRDTVDVPIAPGKVFPGRINTLYWEYQQGKKKKAALKKTKEAFEYAFDTEIDYYALVGFEGVVHLVDAIGGIDVTLDEPLIDPSMHMGKKGLRLKAGDRRLDGKTALAFSRTRHSDSDYERAARQQQVIAAAADKVRGSRLADLTGLIEKVDRKIITDFPMAAAPLLFELAQDAKLGKPKSVVLAPSRWARPGPILYTIAPRVLEIRKMFDRVFRPAG